MELMLGDSYLGMGAMIILILLLSWWVVHSVFWDVKYKWRLPPGSMGYPLLGESLELLFNPNTTFKPAKFFEERQARYGELFKSHLFGEPVVVSTSASVNAFVFQKEGALFQSAYPATFVKLMGKQSLGAAQGQLHSQLRGMVMRVAGSASLPEYLGQIEASLLKRLAAWESCPLIVLHKEACQMAFDVVVKRLVSLSTEDHVEAQLLMHNFRNFVEGLIAFPINLPGTAYNICLKGRAQVVDLLKKIINKRVESRLKQTHFRRGDLLDTLLEEENKNGEMFKRELTMDVMVSMIYAAYETTATALVFAVKLISKHQDVLDKLMVEHTAIKDKKSQSDAKELTWEDYKSMSYTRDVLYETLRLANIAPFVYREALTSVQINGFLIPKGWKIIACLSSAHINANHFCDPLSFNPSRWKDVDSISGNANCFMPFGGGSRLCAGNELALLEISIFLHHFLTKYRWEEVGEEQIIRTPGVKFQNGYPIRVHKKLEPKMST